MPDITVPTFVDGDPFSPATWATALYSPTAGTSLFETSNGHIEYENLHADVEIQTRMIQPWQISEGGAIGRTRPLDFFDDAWNGARQWYGVAGAMRRFYLRKPCSVVWLYCSLFAQAWRMRGEQVDDAWTTPPRIMFRMHLDGAPLGHTRRDMPESIFFDSSGLPASDYTLAREERCTRYFQMHHQCNGLAAGWHSFGWEVLMEQQVGVENIDLNGSGAAVIPNTEYRRQHRVRVYARNAQYLGVR